VAVAEDDAADADTDSVGAVAVEVGTEEGEAVEDDDDDGVTGVNSKPSKSSLLWRTLLPPAATVTCSDDADTAVATGAVSAATAVASATTAAVVVDVEVGGVNSKSASNPSDSVSVEVTD
jgi:hypothetical protein